jgi:hypothetical protein
MEESYTQSAGKLVTHCLETEIIIIIIITNIILNKSYFYTSLLRSMKTLKCVYKSNREKPEEEE